MIEGDTRKIFVSKTVDESNSARVLIGRKHINILLVNIFQNILTRFMNCLEKIQNYYTVMRAI